MSFNYFVVLNLASFDNYLVPFDVKIAFLISYNNDNIKRKIIFEEEIIMSNKTALITGATGGLGKEFVRIHAEKGRQSCSRWSKSTKT